jgi:hypothetical protein
MAPNSIFDTASSAFDKSFNTLASTMNPNALRTSMNQFLNPYQNQVIDQAVGRLHDRKDIDMSNIGASASQAGAFGGSRHGLVEAETFKNYSLEEGEMVSRLLQQGFDTRAGLGAQSLGFQQAGAGQMMGLGTTLDGVGRNAQQMQMQAGSQQQQLLQAILGGASKDFETYKNAPMDKVAKIMSALSGNPLSGNVSKTHNPGLFDFLSLGSGVYAAGK